MAKGDPLPSPWVYTSGDDPSVPQLRISVPFNETTGAILNGTVVHRDVGCRWTTVIFADPTDQLLRKDLPPAPEGDTTLSAQQVRQFTGFRTITDLLNAGQVTAQ